MRRYSLLSLLVLAFLLTVSCDSGVNPSDNGSTYVLKQDSYEDDDADGIFTSNVLKVGASRKQVHSICAPDKSANDTDYFRLDGVIGHSYRIETSAAKGDSIDTVLELKDATSVTKAVGDNTGTTKLATISWWECPATGPYLVLATGREAGYYSIQVDEFVGGKTATPYTQDFEGTLAEPWTSWSLDNVVTHGGLRSIRTAAIGNGDSTGIQLLVNASSPGKKLTFYWRVSSEAKNDLLRCLVDGVVVGSISGTTAWTSVTAELATGDHFVQWEYVKNGTKAADYDCGWLDDITIN